MHYRRLGIVGTICLLLMVIPSVALAQTAAQAHTLHIGVDHLDPANQQLANHREFEYTDFFTRQVTMHRGDTLVFDHNTGFHILALAKSQSIARSIFPTLVYNTSDPIPATGTGAPKIAFGPGTLAIQNGIPQGPVTVCGAVNQSPCTFNGAIEQEGQNATPTWSVQIDVPVGSYDYFCTVHPGMNGKVTVVAGDESTTTQAQIDTVSAQQFAEDQAAALKTERAYNKVRFSGERPGERTYAVYVGINAADHHVAINEMLPNKPLNLIAGDKVAFLWNDPHNVHTVGFAKQETDLPEPFNFDPQYFMVVGDPGNAPSGTILTAPPTGKTDVVDAGILAGKDYGLNPAVRRWSVVTKEQRTAPGTYMFFCSLHDSMVGALNIRADN